MPVPRITPADLQTALTAAAEADRPVVLDARLKYPYAHSTVMIAGAERYSGSVAALPRDRAIVVYDSDPDELVSSAVAAELIRQGYRASALAGGIAAWLAAHGAVTAKDAPKPAAPTGSLKA
ncbi:MAG: rhodanese-like domain-containing protein [Vicinamibacterales bacterium]